MTTVFLPDETAQNTASWIPISWIQNNGLISNPEKEYPWTIGNTEYIMYQYKMRYYQTYSAEWAGSEKVGFTQENNYDNVQIWTELDLTPTWYIEGGGTAYFAVAKMQLAENAIYSGVNSNGETVDSRTTVSVSPESRLSPVYLYYQPFGTDGKQETNPYTYEGKTLNPSLFTDKVYFHVDLNKFGVYWGADYIIFPWTKGDTVTLAVDVTVFVIGEYTVKDIQENPDQYGRFVKEADSTPTFLRWLFETTDGLAFLTFALIAIVIVIVLILVVIYAPWLLTGAAGLIKSLTSSKKG
jgi:hypothetical protein